MKNIHISILIFSSLLFLTAPLNAGDARTPALRVLSDSSDLIVVATIKFKSVSEGTFGSAPIPASSPVVFSRESFPCRIEIQEILKGGRPPTMSPLLTILVPTVEQIDHPDLGFDFVVRLKKGTKWIMFLKLRDKHPEMAKTEANGEPVNLIAFDPWLSVQPYSRSLQLLLTRGD